MESAAYDRKPDRYFVGGRRDYVEELTGNRVLEIGCGSGETGQIALETERASLYCGVELSPRAGARARSVLDEVIVGDVETSELPWPDGHFDVLILSEVLEHLSDPAHVLRKLRRLLSPGARVFASCPNVSHHRIIRMLVAGRWELTDAGPMDTTHLRWFTPTSLAAMFAECGYRVDSCAPHGVLTRKQRFLALATRRPYLFWRQIELRAHVQEAPNRIVAYNDVDPVADY